VVLATLFSAASPAVAVILIAEESEEEFWDYAVDINRKGSLSLAGAADEGAQAPPFFLVTPEAAETLLGASLADARQPRADLGTFEFSIDERVEAVDAWNVAAVFPGRDPARASEYVALGAHYDHVGIGSPVDGDSIYNGADDNASGTSALLEIAERLAHLPAAERPARSILFVWNTAEESGLLGSEHFTDRPTVARESIVAHMNLDMIGRNHPDSLFSVGSRRLSTELGTVVERVNSAQARPFFFDYSYDVPGHPEQIYCRSDHYSYARYGIPIVFLTTGLHDQYHAPSDQQELIDPEKLARVSSLVYDITMELANLPQRPRVDQPVPPLGAPCS
jgi:Zn-dependent M28 family amino/carboxypeptidase